eukprot:5626989-Amphidinium_carterae.1
MHDETNAPMKWLIATRWGPHWVCDSLPSKSLLATFKTVSPATALLGSVPAKRLLCALNKYMVCITSSPLPGSAPSKLFVKTSKVVTALIARMPLSGIVPLKLFV